MKILKKILDFTDDILILAGIIFLFKGAYMIYIPAGFITLGICLIVFAFLIALNISGKR